MISYLSIKNIALIRELELEFKDGLNVLSGETGAGKSIIVDSVNFVLGDRADRSLIRYGETTAEVEVVFSNIKNCGELQSMLADAGIDEEDGTVIVSRKMTNDRSECRVNRKIVTLALLRNIVALLVDTHSQNEHQRLLKVSNHIKLLDAYNRKIETRKKEYRDCLASYNDVKRKLSLFPSPEDRARQIDMLGFQTAEIDRVDWKKGEEDELDAKRAVFYNSQKISAALNEACADLSDESGLGGVASVSRATGALKSIAQYDSSLVTLVDRLTSAQIELQDIADTLCEKTQNGDISNIDVESVERRIEEIRLLKKKYGKTFEETESFYEKAKEKLDFLENSESEIKALNEEKNKIESRLADEAKKLHGLRKETADSFCKVIAANLRELGMKNSVFEIKFDFDENNILTHCASDGADGIEFMLSPNLGEPVKPLAKIASGGETSRFMLALKNVIAETDNVDTLIFDEIDTGISGVIAKVVAQKLYNISRSRQVIAITHLPQLAAMGDVNYLIEKKVVGEKTQTFLKELKGDEIYTEIMRLGGAVENSKNGLSSAIESKKQADDYKASLNAKK